MLNNPFLRRALLISIIFSVASSVDAAVIVCGKDKTRATDGRKWAKCFFFQSDTDKSIEEKGVDLGWFEQISGLREILQIWTIVNQNDKADPPKPPNAQITVLSFDLKKIINQNPPEVIIDKIDCSRPFDSKGNPKSDQVIEVTGKTQIPYKSTETASKGGIKNLQKANLNIRFLMCQMDDAVMISKFSATSNCPLSTVLSHYVPIGADIKDLFVGTTIINNCSKEEGKATAGVMVIKDMTHKLEVDIVFCKNRDLHYRFGKSAHLDTSGAVVDSKQKMESGKEVAISQPADLVPVAAPSGSFWTDCDDTNEERQVSFVRLDVSALRQKYSNSPFFTSKSLAKDAGTQSFGSYLKDQETKFKLGNRRLARNSI